MASKELKNLSSEGQEPQKADSVFDFLYADSKRIASFLSQFTNYGDLTEIVRGEHSGTSTEHHGKASAAGGIPGLASVDGGYETGTSVEQGDSSQKRYDPTWTNALNFLNYLAEFDLLNRVLPSAGMGQFLLTKGRLWVMDLSTLQNIIGNRDISGAFMPPSAPPSGPRQAKAARQSVNPAEVALKFMSILPHLIQARLFSPEGEVWASLLPSGMTMSSADLFMKHGSEIAGEWNMLGILDAQPDTAPTDGQQPDMGQYVNVLLQLSPFIRPFIGRPASSYGLTPLMIFREVTGKK